MKPKTEVVKFRSLRSVGDLTDAHERLYNQQINREIDSKAAGSINNTLKGSVYLKVKLPLEVAKLIIQARAKGINLPDKIPQLP